MTVDNFSIKIYLEGHETIFIQPKDILVRRGLPLLHILESVFTLFGLTVEDWEIVDKTGVVVGSKHGN